VNNSFDYSLKNALFWGNFNYHCVQAKKGNVFRRVFHIALAAIELLPIISQIISLFERAIASPKVVVKLKQPLNNNLLNQEKNYKATLIIQKFIHSYNCQKHLQLLKKKQAEIATIKIQSMIRTAIAQKQLQTKVEQKAALTVQSYIRMHNSHKKVECNKKILLDYETFKKVKVAINTDAWTCSRFGSTQVFMLKDPAIVLKKTGFPENQIRLDKMCKALDLCQKKGLNHIVVPSARLMGTNIIEQRLPVKMYEPLLLYKEQVSFYFENKELFTSAVSQLIDFASQAYLPEITGYAENVYLKLAPSAMARYDNLFLYVEGGQAKIGLVDLEHFDLVEKKDIDWVDTCCQLINLFPCHFDLIWNMSLQHEPGLLKHQDIVEKEKQNVLKRFEGAFLNHYNFIFAKEINTQNYWHYPQISESVKHKIAAKLTAKLLQYRQEGENRFSELLGKNPQLAAETFKETIPRIVDLIGDFFTDIMNKKKESYRKPDSFWQILSFRTLVFSKRDRNLYVLLDAIHHKLHMLDFGEDYDSFLGVNLLELILEELVNEKVYESLDWLFSSKRDAACICL